MQLILVTFAKITYTFIKLNTILKLTTFSSMQGKPLARHPKLIVGNDKNKRQ